MVQTKYLISFTPFSDDLFLITQPSEQQ